MAEFRIDRLRFTWKGNWVTSLEYRKDDVVYYGGKVYVCLQDHLSSTNFFNDIEPASVQTTFAITVSTDNLYGESHGVFYLTGKETPELNLIKGRKYIFNQNDISNKNFNSEIHPLLISTVKNGTLNGGGIYSQGVQYFIDNVEVTQEEYLDNFATSNFRKIEITIPISAPSKLFYFSPNNTNMGGQLNTQYISNWELMFDGYEWKGDWAKGTRYNIDDLIKYNGYIYQCIEEHTSTNLLLEDFIDDISFWTVFSKGYNWRNVWQISTRYYPGDVVTYNGITYVCNTVHQSAANTTSGLEANQSSWTVLSRSDDWVNDWTVSTRYRVDDVVKYGGRIYRCTSGHTSAENVSDGLELDLSSWEIVIDGIEYKSDWQPSVRYKIGDIVKYGASLWKAVSGHTSTTSLRNDEASWDIYVLGLRYEELWNILLEYKKGDIVLYGGYTYLALENNLGSVPSVNGIIQDTGNWELLTTGYKILGDWIDTVAYKTGDIVRQNGYLYVAITDNNNVYPDSNILIWQLLVPSNSWRAEWEDNVEYYLGDVVTYKSTAYICINRHLSSASDARPDLDQELIAADYWNILIQGTPTNVLSDRGDLKTYTSEVTRLAIGDVGRVLKSNGTLSVWDTYDIVSNVFYVSMNGQDTLTSGRQITSPFRTVAYACQFIQDDVENRTPATIFIKTGIYEENLPITVPKNTALVGDELRSTIIQPALGEETKNMFYVRNGSGIRNMTLQGLTGLLGEPNEFLTRRPTAGAYVSLDPGTGPTDSSAWITSKSPYVQNVTTFGTACVGMKVDGSLHNGGNRSIVANDFTQVLSDGIGYWATDGGRSELVSVFTYYCHIGYLAEHGGILRATNGNNSYGTYGSVAEGFDQNETPINGSINNRNNEASIDEIFTFGTVEQQIFAVGYDHAGQSYSSATISFNGSGINAAGNYIEYRDNAISNIRMLDPGDSSIPGGFGYQFVANYAQSGSDGFITIANADVGTPSQYIGMRMVIVSGKGVGQYGEITDFNATTKLATISRESDGALGWDHFQPGWPIESTLDSTTRYVIEPRIYVSEPAFVTSAVTGPSNDTWKYIKFGENKWVAVSEGGAGDAYSTYSINGTSWSSRLSLGSGFFIGGLVYTGSKFLAVREQTSINGNVNTILQSANGETWGTVSLGTSARWAGIASNNAGIVVLVQGFSAGTVLRSTNDGDTWSSIAIGDTATWGPIAYGNGKFVILDTVGGKVAYSTNNGTSWTVITPLTSGITWNSIAYGNGRFVAIDDSSGVRTKTAYSFNGIDWYENEITLGDLFNVSYGAGVFLATGTGNLVAKSADGKLWRTFDEDSTSFTTTITGNWENSAYGNGKWIVVNNASNQWNSVQTGARAILRARIETTRIRKVLIYDPGSNYTSTPIIDIIDNENTVNAQYSIFINNGVLPQPEMSNRGEGYVTATATITGDGFAEIFQTGRTLNFSNVSDIPGPGANLEITGIDDVRYSIADISNITGTGPYSFTATILPNMGVGESPAHSTSFIIRERYSQIRLTGHDFLDIGTGNINSTRYPTLYLEGEDAENERQPFNETVASGGGRVFYTSTDQDGNFRVGELFQVEQARGVVTISASQFDLSGLTELRLGGIQVGGSAVVIREFSKDPTFIADSNNIVPTQKAIKSYITSRISGGGANVQTNTLISGQIRITGNTINTTSSLPINLEPLVILTSGYTGALLAQQYMLRGTNTQLE